MALFNWQNGNKTQSAVVTGDGVTVQDAVWEGETPISASNLNSAQTQLVAHIENEINTNLGTETDTWSSASSYSIGARVKYAGGVYKNLTGNNSSAPNIDTTNWELIPIVDNNGHLSDMKWNYLTQVTGTTHISLPSTFNELLVVGEVTSYHITYTINIPYDYLEPTQKKQYISGYYSASQDSGMYDVIATQSELYLEASKVAGSDKKSGTTTTVYYR